MLKYDQCSCSLILKKGNPIEKNHHNSGEEKNSNPDEPPDINVTTKYETIEDGTEAFMQWMDCTRSYCVTCLKTKCYLFIASK
jgi:hypothetical protein